ncbi:MAG: DUF6470 family protein [Sporolactobacillus sp.]|jgi:hypothetical protein|nr:DUF6470 family protein [Sporolactobacillus sp.]
MATVMPHLEMHQVYGRITMRTQPASLAIRQPHAEQSIEQPKATLTIDRRPAQLTIDQSAAWHNLDLKSAIVRNRESAQAGRQTVLDGIARRAREGDELLHIEQKKGKNVLAQQAAARAAAAYIGTTYDTGHTPPFLSVRYTIDPGYLHVDWQRHNPQIQSTTHAPEYTYYPGDVQIKMAQYPSLDIRAVGLFVDEKG